MYMLSTPRMNKPGVQVKQNYFLTLQGLISFAIIMALCLLTSKELRAQFMRLEIAVEDNIVIGDFRWLQTGFVPINYGWVNINIDDEDAGRFNLRTDENVNILVTVQSPDELVMDQMNRLPFRLNVAYLNDDIVDFSRATPFNGKTANIRMHPSPLLRENMRNRQGSFQTNIFFYGAVYVGLVDPGVYRGEVRVRIEFL